MFPLCDGSICNHINTETYFRYKYNILDSSIDTSTIGGKILYYRLSKNLNQIELAELVKMNRSTIIRLENNQVQPSLYILNKISSALEVDINLLLDDFLIFLLDYSNTIKSIRKDYNLTQVELAVLLKVHRKTISRWEKGMIQPTKEHYRLLMSKVNMLQLKPKKKT